MSESNEQYHTVNSDKSINNSVSYQENPLSSENLCSDDKKSMPLSDHLEENETPPCHTAFPVDLKEVFELTNPSEEIHQPLLRPANLGTADNSYVPPRQTPTSRKEETQIPPANEQGSWTQLLEEQPNHREERVNTANSINSNSECTPLPGNSPGTRDVSCQVGDNLHKQVTEEEAKYQNGQIPQTKSNSETNCCIPTSSGVEEDVVPQSLLNLTIVTEAPVGSEPQVVVHNGIRPELYTQERHLIVEVGAKAQASSRSTGTFHCNHCGKMFGDSRSLQRHILIHVGLRPYRCPVCAKAFMLNGDLTRHLRIHSGERPYACDVCGRRFTLKGNLMQHFRTHTPEKQYACTICEKNYAQKDSLHRHIRAHFGEKPFECTTCGKRFTLKGDLSRHVLIHSGLKPHTCKFCGRQFALKGNLTQHIRTHAKSRPNPNIHFVKTQAEPQLIRDLTYSHIQKTLGSVPVSTSLSKLPLVNNVSTTSHVVNVSSPPNPYIQTSSTSVSIPQGQSTGLSFCSECSKTFSSSESLHEHVQLIHEQSTRLATNRYMCNLCQKEFCLKGDLTRHLNSHNGIKPYECEHCNKTFTLKSNLRQHLTTHRMDKSFSCPMCGKPFGNRRNLNLHLKRHEQARANFTCTKCGRSFLAKSDHFFHQCVKTEASSPLPESSNHGTVVPDTTVNSVSLPSSPPEGNCCPSTAPMPANAISTLPAIAAAAAFPVKRELCQLSCNTREMPVHPDNMAANVSGVNGTQAFLGPFYRHLYFSTSHQTMLPTLKGLLGSPPTEPGVPDYNRIAKTNQ